MSYITWDHKFSVDVDIFDGHHKKLVSLINQLHDAMKKGKSREVLETILDELISYTKYHFNEEERWMQQRNYPGYHGHKSEHDNFVKTVQEFKEEVNQGNQVISISVMNFLKDWLLSHIMGTDKRYSTVC